MSGLFEWKGETLVFTPPPDAKPGDTFALPPLPLRPEPPRLELWIPGQVRGKKRTSPVMINGQLRVLANKTTRNYEKELKDTAIEEMERQGWKMVPAGVAVRVRMTVLFIPAPSSSAKWKKAALEGIHRPTKKPDADNTLKLIDGLNKILWHDDAQVTEATVSKLYAEREGLWIEVTRI